MIDPDTRYQIPFNPGRMFALHVSLNTFRFIGITFYRNNEYKGRVTVSMSETVGCAFFYLTY